jgi:hypothetical protein
MSVSKLYSDLNMRPKVGDQLVLPCGAKREVEKVGKDFIRTGATIPLDYKAPECDWSKCTLFRGKKFWKVL